MPVTPTYVALAEVTLASGVAEVVLPAPSGYRDLVVVYNGETVSSGNYDITLKLNGDTSNYSFVAMVGDGTNKASFTASTFNLYNIGTANQSACIFQVMDYSATDKHKTSLVRLNSAGGQTGAGAQRWASTSAVTSVTIGIGSGTFATGSTFMMYGIEA